MGMYGFFHITHNVLPLVFPVLIWLVLLMFMVSLLFAIDDGIRQLRRLHQIPCDRCSYHTGSAYLRCPVHPTSAFSEDAIDCIDYEPKQCSHKSQPKRPFLATSKSTKY